MPPVILAVMAVGASAISAIGGTALLAGLSMAAYVGVTLVGGVAVLFGGQIYAALMSNDSFSSVGDGDRSRQVTVRGTIEPHKIVYGQALVSGPVSFIGVSGPKNNYMHHVIALAGHEVSEITDIWLDDEVILEAQYDNDDGEVTAGTFAPRADTNVVTIFKYLGTSSQAVDVRLLASFTGYTSAHRGRGIAYMHTIFNLFDETQELWDSKMPNAIKALVKGKIVYDPRLDSVVGQSPANVAYAAWSDNPALCVADYLTDTMHGMRIPAAKIDWPAVVSAANSCDQLVAIPVGQQQKRFTCNGVLYSVDAHQTNVSKLLSSMNGTLVYTSGMYKIRAGVYEAPVYSLSDDDLTGVVGVKTSVERSERYNTVGGVFVNPEDNHKSSEFQKVQITAALARDNNEILEREIELSFTNDKYMAQRLAHKLIQISDQQKQVTFPCNYKALNVAVGDRVNLTLPEFSWSNKVFRCMGWSFSDDGVNLALQEDDAGSYADPLEAEYSTISANGVIALGFAGVPDPQNLTAVAGVNSIDLNWVNPANSGLFSTVVLFASPTSAWSGAVEIGRGNVTTFKHDAGTAADPITAGAERYYWVRAVGIGASSASFSDRNPDNDVSSITATAVANIADSVDWVDVSNASGGRPSNNATVGAQASVNLLNSDGSVISDAAILNEVIRQEILTIELESGDILDLESGDNVDIQNLGDVAVWAYDASVILQGSVANLSSLLADITSGVGDVYVRAARPVAGVDGVSDPIVISSRWYDSDDSNAPYYWSGSAWVSLLDPRIASNEAAITQLNADLTTLDGEQTATATALSTLDATVVDIDGILNTSVADITALESTVDDPATGVDATSTALVALDARVVTAEDFIGSASTDVVDLVADIRFYNQLEDEGEGIATLEFEDGETIDLQTPDDVGAALSEASRALDVRTTASEAQIVSQASDLTSLRSDLSGVSAIGNANAVATTALTTRVSAAEGTLISQAEDITSISSGLTNAQNDLSINASAISALTTRVSAAEGTITSQSTSITSLNSSLGTTNVNVTANANATSSLGTRVAAAEGSISSISTSVTSLNNALGSTNTNVAANAGATTALGSRVSSAEGNITSISSSITSLNTTVGSNSSSITSQQTSINGIAARYGVTIDVNGNMSGFELLGTGATSAFRIRADQFLIVDPASPAGSPQSAWLSVVGGVTTLQNLTVNGNLLVTGTVGTGQLAANSATFAPNAVDGSTRNYSGVASHLVQTLATFTSAGYAAEFLADIKYAGGGIAPTVTLKLNGVVLTTVLSFGGTNLIVVGGNTVSGNNSLTLHFNSATNEPSGGEFTSVYSSYLRVLEFRR
jgi:hypothetical protein